MTEIQFLACVLAKVPPILLAALGGLFAELSGVINFALEGMMLTGAFAAVWGSFVWRSPWLGLLAGALGGMLMGALHALLCLRLKANQIVSSIALNLLSAGVSGLLLHQVFAVYGTSPSVPSFPRLSHELLEPLTILGRWPLALEGLSLLAPASILFGLLVIGCFRCSAFGLRIRACGENPLAARAAGLRVVPLRFAAVTLGGALVGLAGAYLSIGELSQFVEHMSQGRGYLAVAAVVLGAWKPLGVVVAAILFGVFEALSEFLSVSYSHFPQQLLRGFPYGVCLLTLLVWKRRGSSPSALGRD
jgi:simple sugar transport system permease protein